MDPLVVDLACEGVTYSQVRVHGAGGLLTNRDLPRLQAWISHPHSWPKLRVYTFYSNDRDEWVDLETSRVRLIGLA